MARLDIKSPSGKIRQTALPAGAALTVGRAESCDVRVNADGVQPLHCRFQPDGDGYRMTAGFEAGVKVNGTAVAEKKLAEGDELEVGPARFTFRAERPEPAAGDESMELAAVSSDSLPTWADPGRAKKSAAKRPAAKSVPAPAAEAPAEETPKPAREPKKKPASKEKPSDPQPAAPVDEFDDADDGEDGLGALAALVEDETGEAPDLAADPDEPAKPAKPSPDEGEQPVLLPPGGKFAPLTKLAGPPRRPGEQSIFKSPLVIGLTTTAGVLVLAAFAVALLTARERAQRLYDVASAARSGGQYTVALTKYDEFLRDYPADELTAAVRTERGLAAIEQNVAGTGGKWAEGVAEIENFVREMRDREDFDATAPALAGLARTAALGAAAEASRGGSRALLETIEQAGTLHRRYADPESAATADRVAEIKLALRDATAAVVKRETFGEAREKVDAALKAGDYAAAHRAREDLLKRYADLAKDRDVRKLKSDTLDAEADAVTPIAAADAPPAAPPRPAALVPAFVSRSGTSERSDGRSVLTRAGPTLFAVDAVTGEPAWRASVGAGGAAEFPPARADAAGSAVLVCDAVKPALVSIDRTTGAVRWRLPLPAPATGPPRTAGGAALVGCADGSLLYVDPETGAVTGGLKFPQSVKSPPVPVGEEDAGRLFLAGRQNTVYTLSGNPPALEAVSYTGHGAGAVPVPPLHLRRFVLLCDNDRADAALLRAFAVDPDSGEATEVGQARVAGRIDVEPELRGERLFVSSSPERMAAFAVSEDDGRKTFSRLAAAQLPDPRPVPTYLAAGPDGLLWAAGSALRKLQLTGDGLQLSQAVLAAGRHVEPPTTSGERLFTTRLTPAGDATIFAAANAEEMIGLSRTVLAPLPLAVTTGDRPALLSGTGVLTELVDFGDAGSSTFLTNGRALPTLDGDGDVPVLARSLADGGAVAAVGGDRPRAWEIGPDGRAGRPTGLPAAPQLAPVPLGPGLLVPVAGRLELVPTRGSRSVSPFSAPVAEGEPPVWTAAVRLTETRAAVVDAAGGLRLIDYRDAPSPNLAEAAALSADWYADVPPAAFGDALFVAGSDGTLHRLGASTLGETAAVKLPARAAFGPAVVSVGGADRVLVACENGTVVGFDAADLKNEASTKLPAPAVGPPATLDGAAGVATAAGVVVKFDPVAGEVTGTADVGQPLAGGLYALFGGPAATAADGAVVRLTFGESAGGETPAVAAATDETGTNR